MTPEQAALGALQIQKFGMTQNIEINSVRRGYDPRDFTLCVKCDDGRAKNSTPSRRPRLNDRPCRHW